MNCIMKNNQLTITTSPKDGAKIPNVTVNGVEFSNIAGIAEVSGTIYCIKSNNKNQTTIVSTDNYRNKDTGKTSECMLNYYCVGLTTDGTDLFLTGSVKNSSGKASGKLLRVNKEGEILKVYSLDRVYAGIAYYGNDNFLLVSSDDKNKTLNIDVYNLSNGYQKSEGFQLVNSGYAEMIQDIYYDNAHGLFVVTNQKDANGEYTPCKNIILLYDLKNKPNGALKAKTRFRLNYSTSTYQQFNTESMCIIHGKMVTAANVKLKSGGYIDRFSYVDDMDISECGTVFMEHDLTVGRKINNRKLAESDLVSPDDLKYGAFYIAAAQGLSFAIENNTKRLMGLKQGYALKLDGAGDAVADTNKSYVQLFEITGDYMSSQSTFSWKKLFKYSPEKSNLYHGNSMNYSVKDKAYYVGCAEPKEADRHTVVKMNTKGEISGRFDVSPYRTNAVAPYKDNKFIIVSGTKAETYNGEKLRPILIGIFAGTGFTVSDIFYFRDTSKYHVTYNKPKHYMQDIYYHENYGLYIASSLLEEKEKNIKFKNDLMHIDLNRFEWVKAASGKRIKVVTPDYSLVYKKRNVFDDIEYESPILDESTGKMILSVNAHKLPAASGGDRITYDCIVQIKGITFS